MEVRRLLYVGTLREGTTSLYRVRGMQRLGYEVVTFDTNPYLSGGTRLTRSLGWRFNWGPSVRRVNEDLQKAAGGYTGVTHVWIEKGVWIWPSTLRQLKRATGARLVHFTPDAALTPPCRSRHFVRSLADYDLLFTTKPYELDLYRRLGGRKTFLIDQGYDSESFYPREPDARYACDVLFIGHREEHYIECLRAVVSLPVDLKIWGPGWKRWCLPFSWDRKHVQGDGIWGREYPAALCSAKIALGLLTQGVPDTTTTRTFEIPACGTFMLAERTPEHLKLFEEGREAEFFGTTEELREKIRRYLSDPDARRRVAAAGRERCLRSRYSNEDRIREIFRLIREAD